MGKFGNIKELERRIRSSKVYSDWIRRNKGIACLSCSSGDNLQCHHVVTLYTCLMGLCNFYGDDEEAYTHALSMHENDRIECVTLCEKCHDKKHPGRRIAHYKDTVKIEEWTAAPRVMNIPFNHEREMKPNTLNLIAFQTLLGIGWHIMNGHLSSRMMEFNRRRFADMIGKEPGTSFNRALDSALGQLNDLEIVAGHHCSGNLVEVHLTQKYISELKRNPWFFPLREVVTSRMSVLALKWVLSFINRRRWHKIGPDKLRTQLGITTSQPSRLFQVIEESCNEIGWATCEMDGEFYKLGIHFRGSTPINVLRQTLDESI